MKNSFRKKFDDLTSKYEKLSRYILSTSSVPIKLRCVQNEYNRITHN